MFALYVAQITGDLTWVDLHVKNYLKVCEVNIRGTVNVTDPTKPMEDPDFANIMGAVLNATCPNNCSWNGYCNLGQCVCNEGQYVSYYLYYFKNINIILCGCYICPNLILISYNVISLIIIGKPPKPRHFDLPI